MDRHWHPQHSTLNYGIFVLIKLRSFFMTKCLLEWTMDLTLLVQSCYSIAGCEKTLWPLCKGGDYHAGRVWAQWNHSGHSWGWTGDKEGLENNTTHYPYCEWGIYIGIDYCSVIPPCPIAVTSFPGLKFVACSTKLAQRACMGLLSRDVYRRTCF